MAENNPNRRMVLIKNPNYHIEYYPNSRERLPLLEKVIFSLEKESIPLWNKFLQGYYDFSGVNSETFDQTIDISADGNMELSPSMRAKGIRFKSSIWPLNILHGHFICLGPSCRGILNGGQKAFVKAFLNCPE